jgi:tripartite-type tricarboxylate transporter receptor subunit TctC
MPGLHRRCEGGILASERSVDRSRHGDCGAGSREKSFEVPIPLGDLLKLARSRPGGLNYGSSGNGSLIQLGSELFKMAAKIEMAHVPNKSSGPAFADLIGGPIQVLFSSSVSSLPHVNSGKVRGLGLTSA